MLCKYKSYYIYMIIQYSFIELNFILSEYFDKNIEK